MLRNRTAVERNRNNNHAEHSTAKKRPARNRKEKGKTNECATNIGLLSYDRELATPMCLVWILLSISFVRTLVQLTLRLLFRLSSFYILVLLTFFFSYRRRRDDSLLFYNIFRFLFFFLFGSLLFDFAHLHGYRTSGSETKWRFTIDSWAVVCGRTFWKHFTRMNIVQTQQKPKTKSKAKKGKFEQREVNKHSPKWRYGNQTYSNSKSKDKKWLSLTLIFCWALAVFFFGTHNLAD